MIKKLIGTKYFIGKSLEEDLSDFKPMFKADTLKEVMEAKKTLRNHGIGRPKVIYTETYEVRDS